MIKLRELIYRVILSSTFLITNAEANSTETPDYNNDYHIEQIYNHSEHKIQSKEVPKLILKKSQTSEDDMFIAGHRSHRSHSSHRSHYSSGGSGHRSHYSHYSHYSSSGSDGSSNYQKSAPSSYTNEFGSRILAEGMKGPDVREMENLLVNKGYSLKPDEYFDAKSVEAVKHYQGAMGLTVDGKVGPMTAFFLKNDSTKTAYKKIEKKSAVPKIDTGMENKEFGSRLLEKGNSGPDVLELEKLLVTKGYKLKPDEYFDDYLELVVKDFQARKGIPVDGKVGPLTIYHLKKK